MSPELVWSLLAGITAILVTLLGAFLKHLHTSLAETKQAVSEKADRAELKEIFNTIRIAVENQSDTNVQVAQALGELRGALNGMKR